MDEKIKIIHSAVKRLKSIIPSATVVTSKKESDKYHHDEHSSDSEITRPEEVIDHLGELSQTVELINRMLKRNKSAYRLRVRLENEEILIDIELLGKSGEVVEVKTKNITHQDFSDFIRHILEGEGLIFNGEG